jgi:hypothetical protein
MVEQFMFECAAYMETASEQLSGLLICELIGASQEYPQSTVESNPEKNWVDYNDLIVRYHEFHGFAVPQIT